MYKMVREEINIKSRVYNYYDDLIKVDNKKAKNTILDEKSYKDLVINYVR